MRTVIQELAEAERQGAPITRAEAEQRVKEFFEKELEDFECLKQVKQKN